jgi:opacity protein-like surface antigen
MKKYIKIAILALVVLTATEGFGQKSFFAMTYSTTMPLGKTKDFISNYSWRGFALEGRAMVTPNIAMGGYAAWNVMYNKFSGTFVSERNGNEVSYTGTQQRYYNSFPIMVTGFYQFMNNRKVIPYLGTGIGVFRNEERVDIGVWSISSNGWQFGFQPEVGVMLGNGGDTNLLISLKYNYGLKTKDMAAYSGLNINIGLAFMGY